MNCLKLEVEVNNETVLLEIQGTLNTGVIEDRKEIGDLEYNDDGTVSLTVGGHQKLYGTVEKLDNPLGVIKRKENSDDLQIVDIIRTKLLFKSRPEPV